MSCIPEASKLKKKKKKKCQCHGGKHWRKIRRKLDLSKKKKEIRR